MSKTRQTQAKMTYVSPHRPKVTHHHVTSEKEIQAFLRAKAKGKLPKAPQKPQSPAPKTTTHGRKGANTDKRAKLLQALQKHGTLTTKQVRTLTNITQPHCVASSINSFNGKAIILYGELGSVKLGRTYTLNPSHIGTTILISRTMEYTL